MQGVFGAGVATAFQEQNIYPKINAVYGASAGAMVGAYFLSKQTRIGSSIFWEDFSKDFISYKGFAIGVWQRLQDRFIKAVPQNKLRDAVNSNYMMSVVTDKKRLDTAQILTQNIPLYVKLFNIDTHSIEYIDARRSDILEILKAGVNVFPYTHEVTVIDGKRYIDGAIIDIVGIDLLKQKHPKEKIIIVVNGQIDRKLRYRMKNILEGKFMQWMFNDPALYNFYASAEDKLARDIKKIKADPYILLITQEKDFAVRSRTTDAKLLLDLYNSGIEEGSRALQSSFMNS